MNSLLTTVAPLGRCAALRALTLTGCRRLHDLAGLGTCQQLAALYLTACHSLRDVTPLVECAALRVLYLNRCPALTDASELGRCPSLEILNLRCSGVEIVPVRAGLHVRWDAEAAEEHAEFLSAGVL